MAWNPKRKDGKPSGAQLNAMLFNLANRTPADAMKVVPVREEPVPAAPTVRAVPPLLRKKTA